MEEGPCKALQEVRHGGGARAREVWSRLQHTRLNQPLRNPPTAPPFLTRTLTLHLMPLILYLMPLTLLYMTV